MADTQDRDGDNDQIYAEREALLAQLRETQETLSEFRQSISMMEHRAKLLQLSLSKSLGKRATTEPPIKTRTGRMTEYGKRRLFQYFERNPDDVAGAAEKFSVSKTTAYNYWSDYLRQRNRTLLGSA